MNPCASVTYTLDGVENVSPPSYDTVSSSPQGGIIHFNLTDLPNGAHTLSIHVSATADGGFTSFVASTEPVAFTINSLETSDNPAQNPKTNPTVNQTSPKPTLALPQSDNSTSSSPTQQPTSTPPRVLPQTENGQMRAAMLRKAISVFAVLTAISGVLGVYFKKIKK